MFDAHGGAGVISSVLSHFPARVAVPDEQMLENVRSALGRGLSPPKLCRPHDRLMSIAGGGPSLSETWRELDGVIVTANAGLGFLLEKGVTPWACGLLDAREHIADLIEPHPDVFFFVSSTCHPRVFDKLRDCKVVLWHPSGAPGISGVLPKGSDLIAGGCTMGLRWVNLGHYMGFRRFNLHGLDSSYRGRSTHAYADSRDGQEPPLIIDGYPTAPNFLQQVEDWFQLKDLLVRDDEKVELKLFGDGLLQHSTRKRESGREQWAKRPASKALNVVCVSTGDYLGRGEDYVAHLLSGVAKHYTGEARFHVLRDGPASWWAKLQLFQPGRFPKGERVVYFDLDTVITGDLSDLFDYDGPFAALDDVWQPGQMGSGVMTWTAGECDHIWTEWVKAGCPSDDPRGDQAWITRMMPGAVGLQQILPGQLGSWKANFGGDAANIGPDVRVVYFHGAPRPHETELWNI